jgi:hypothetical protein
MLVFINVLSLLKGITFFIYIPSKYEIPVPEDKEQYSLIELEVNEDGDLLDSYMSSIEPEEIEKTYEEVDLDVDPKTSEGRLKSNLEIKYNRPIELKKSNQNKKNIKDSFRQLNRLKLCVKNLKYKLGILHKNYFSFIRRDDSLSCFIIKKFKESTLHQLFVIVELEIFYANDNTLLNDIQTIEDGILKVLQKNETSHKKVFQSLLESEKNISEENYALKKDQLHNTILTLRNLLSDINKASSHIQKEIVLQEEKYNKKTNNIHTDIEKTHLINKLTNDLEKVNDVKKKILESILFVKSQQEDMYLSNDKFLFDNNVMLHSILQNLQQYYNNMKQ